MSEWISVKDGMPELGQTVLVYHDCGADILRYDRFYGRGRNGEPTWIDEHGDDSSSYGLEEFGVTHWMPLPEPPKD